MVRVSGLLLMPLLALSWYAQAQESEPVELPDDELLAFIGSWEGDESSWLEAVRMSWWLGDDTLGTDEKISED